MICLFVCALCVCARVSCSFEGKINHYLVAMDFTTKKLTINGERYFDSLPELVQVSKGDIISHDKSHDDMILQVYAEKPGPLGCVLSHPLTRRGVLDFHIDQEALKKSEWCLEGV